MPNSTWKVSELRKWLSQRNILHVETIKKDQLLKFCALVNKKIPKKFIIDEYVAKNTCHEILRLPPYHCQYNPIELVWGIAKRFYDKNIGFAHEYNDAHTNEIWKKSLQHITPEVWKNICVKVDREITRNYIIYVLGLSKNQRQNGEGLFKETFKSSSSECHTSDSESDSENEIDSKLSGDETIYT